VTFGTALAAGVAGAAAGDTCSESTGPNLCEANDNVPDFTARVQYSAPGGHKFEAAGVVRNLRIDGDAATGGVTGSDSEVAWGLMGAAAIKLADIATLSAVATYGDGVGRYIINGGFASAVAAGTAANPDLETIEAWGVAAALGLGVTETVTMNFVLGYFDQTRSDIIAGQIDDLTTVHANMWWQPVDRFRMGVEGMWGNNDIAGAGTEDALRFQFGAEFYF
ncbi:MAG: hypothetical protein ACR2PM_13260, partial [Hyphomicrobiales bacterium]